MERGSDLGSPGQLRIPNARHDVAGGLHVVGQRVNPGHSSLGIQLCVSNLATIDATDLPGHCRGRTFGNRRRHGDVDVRFDHDLWKRCLLAARMDSSVERQKNVRYKSGSCRCPTPDVSSILPADKDRAISVPAHIFKEAE